MTRCLDCGAVRTSDECPVCGLTSAAAEFVFRRRLLLQMAIFLTGSLLFPYVSQIYAPLDSPKNVSYHAATVDSRYLMKGVVRGTRRLVVSSWRAGHRYERLAVDLDDFDRFRPGDKIVVGVEPGALGIPWFYGVYREGSGSRAYSEHTGNYDTHDKD